MPCAPRRRKDGACPDASLRAVGVVVDCRGYSGRPRALQRPRIRRRRTPRHRRRGPVASRRRSRPYRRHVVRRCGLFRAKPAKNARSPSPPPSGEGVLGRVFERRRRTDRRKGCAGDATQIHPRLTPAKLCGTSGKAEVCRTGIKVVDPHSSPSSKAGRSPLRGAGVGRDHRRRAGTDPSSVASGTLAATQCSPAWRTCREDTT